MYQKPGARPETLRKHAHGKEAGPQALRFSYLLKEPLTPISLENRWAFDPVALILAFSASQIGLPELKRAGSSMARRWMLHASGCVASCWNDSSHVAPAHSLESNGASCWKLAWP